MEELFKPHGSSVIYTEGNILVIDAEGPWNDEFFLKFHAELIEIAKELDINNYATLIMPRGEALGVQDGLERHVAFVRKSGSKALAICLKHSSIPDISRFMCTKMYDQVGIEYQFFDEEDDAKVWLLTFTSA